MSAEALGLRAVEAVAESDLVRVDPASARAYAAGEADGVVFVWSANAGEQVGHALLDYLRNYSPRAVDDLVAEMEGEGP